MIRLLPDCAPTTIADQVAGLDLSPLAREDRPYVITNFAVTLDGHATIAGRSGSIGSATEPRCWSGCAPASTP